MKQLFNALKNRTFMPFVGAGASSLPAVSGLPGRVDRRRWPWSDLADQLDAVRRGLDPMDAKYLERFVSTRIAGRLGLDEAEVQEAFGPNSLPTEPDREREDGLEALVRFQRSLITATRAGMVAIGRALGDHPVPVHELRLFAVELDPVDGEWSQAVSRLMEAADAARELIRYQEIRPPHIPDQLQLSPILQTRQIYKWLLCVVRHAIDRRVIAEPGFSDWLKKHNDQAPLTGDQLDNVPERGAIVRLATIEWFEELAWYTFRYWLPMHPTSGELAFELSLDPAVFFAHQDLVYAVGLSQIAEAVQMQADDFRRSQDMSRKIADRFRYCEHYASLMSTTVNGDVTQDGCPTFYDALAEALWFIRGSKPLADRSNQPAALASGAPRRMVIAFSTNYDQLIEGALRRCGYPYEVVFPVLRKGEVGVKWVRRVWQRLGDKYECEDYDDEETKSKKDLAPRPTSPVIVKLHGSPLEPMDQHQQCHWVVLTESSYLDTMLKDIYRLPQWVEDELRSAKTAKRSMWFFGYSLSDWNMRLRLHEHIRSAEGRRGEGRDSDLPASTAAVQKYAVVRDFNAVECAFLESLQVNALDYDLNQLSKMMADVVAELQ